MVTTLKRIHAATGTVALGVALLALLASAAGAGYAASQIGTNDIADNAVTADKIKKNAVTSKKIKKNAITSKTIKDGSLQVADLAPQQAQTKPTLSNGGEGDCIWQSGEVVVPGVGLPTYRKDRDDRVILTGVAVVSDGAGGDADCNPSAPGQASDGILFTLPPGYIPAKTLYMGTIGGLLLIGGPQGTMVSGMVVPPGAVFSSGLALLDGIEFDAAGSGVTIARMKPSGQLGKLPFQ